jgi:outer membrane protein assembly factor BamA
MNDSRKGSMLIFLALEFAFQAASRSYALAQDLTGLQEGTRIELLERQQEEKARNPIPAKPHKVELILDKYVGEDPLNKCMGGIPGLHLHFGGLPSGAGFVLGPEYLRTDLAGGQVSFRASAIGSMKLWYLIETELEFPHLARQHLDLSFREHRMDANSIDYYGPGPDSQKTGRSNYRREESAVDFSLDFRPTRRYLSLGFSAGYQWYNVGPGQSDAFIPTEEQYPESVAPGINTQTNYLRMGPFLEVDSRDKPKDPHGGTHLLVRFNQFEDRKLERYSFRQIDACFEQYIPFFNQKRVLALRARSVLSYPQAGSVVPFYMQPTLGGSSDLRGYHRYRFYDNNSFLIAAEYRWEIFTLMDAALFGDAGKVFQRDGDFNLKELESDFGFGLRFKSRRAVLFRIDTAFSHEGYGLWIRFDHVF